MKTIYSYLSCLCLFLFMLTGCEDSYNHPNEEGIPLAQDINCTVSVNQETNEVTFKMNNPQCNPVWIFDEKDYSTVNGLTRVFAAAGTYVVEVKISNSNGVSDGSVTKEFTIENTLIDFTRYIKMFAGDETKEWVMAKDEAGHLSCGESGSDGTGWWMAQANEKEEFGVYDDVLTFSTDKKYTFNPGESGSVYVNTGCTIFSEYNTGSDFVVPASESTVDYDFTVIGNDVYMVLPPKAYLSYIPNDETYEMPRFKIASMKANRIELIADNGAIAWRYILVTKTQELSREEKLAGTWVWAKDKLGHLACGESGSDGTGWWMAQANEKEAFGLYNHKLIFTADGSYTFNPGDAASFYVNVGCTLFPSYNTGESDFNVPTEPQNSTWKFVDEGADTYLVFPAQTIVGYVANDAAWTAPKFKLTLLSETELKLVFDNGEIAWQYYFIKEGTGEEPKDEPIAYDPDSEFNLWKNCNFTIGYFYAPGWNQIADPQMTSSGNSYTFKLPEATTDQWQAQVFFRTDIVTDSQTNYDFCAIFNSNQDLGRVTVKLVKEDDDEIFYFLEMISLTAYEDRLISFADMKGLDMEKVKLVLDFGGNPANTEVTVSGIVLKDHSKDDGSGKDNTNWDANSPFNLWRNDFTNSFYYAPGWTQIADPTLKVSGNNYELFFPQATTDQWQAQVFFKTKMQTIVDKKYDFRCVLNSDKDISRVTIKLVKQGDDETFFFTETVALQAYEDFDFKMPKMQGIAMDAVDLVFDFGGNSAQSKVIVSEVLLKDSAEN